MSPFVLTAEGGNKMNKMILLVLLLVSIIFVAGCETDRIGNGSKGVGVNTGLNNELNIYTLCADGVVCYFHPSGYAGGMDCFRATDLVEKYCGG